MAKLAPTTLSDLVFQIREISSGRQDLLIRQGEKRETLSAPDLLSNVHALVLALEEEGIEKGDRIALFSENRPEWPAVEFACHLLGCIVVPLRADTEPEAIGYRLRNSRSRMIFYSGQAQHDLLQDLERALTSPPRLIAFESSAARDDEMSFTRLLGQHSARRAEIPLERFRGRTLPDDPAILFYPASAEGDGVVFSQSEALQHLLSRQEIPNMDLDREDLLLSHLPLSDLRQWALDLYAFSRGARLVYSSANASSEGSSSEGASSEGELEKLLQVLLEERPTVVTSETGFFEYLARKIRAEIEQRGGLAQKGFSAALDDSSLKAKLSRRFLLGPIRESLGLDRLRCGLCCGESLVEESRKVFDAVGIPVHRADFL